MFEIKIMLMIIKYASLGVILFCFVWAVMTTKADIAAPDSSVIPLPDIPIVGLLRFLRAASPKIRSIVVISLFLFLVCSSLMLVIVRGTEGVVLASMWLGIWIWGFFLCHRFLRPIYQELDKTSADTHPVIWNQWRSLKKNQRLQVYIWIICIIIFLWL